MLYKTTSRECAFKALSALVFIRFNLKILDVKVRKRQTRTVTLIQWKYILLTAECEIKVYITKYADLWAQRDSWNSTKQRKELDFGKRRKKKLTTTCQKWWLVCVFYPKQNTQIKTKNSNCPFGGKEESKTLIELICDTSVLDHRDWMVLSESLWCRQAWGTCHTMSKFNHVLFLSTIEDQDQAKIRKLLGSDI